MKMSLRRICPRIAAGLVLAIAAAVFLPGTGLARERIVGFDSDITIQRDATVLVRETITVISERRDIRRGIYRDFPTDYRTERGARVRVGFEVLSVTRNGSREAYHSEKQSNGVRVYIGNKDRLIRPGRHVYVLTYRTDRQLGFFDGFDEFYWNVTGLAWKFPIERVSALIRLPNGARVTSHAGYTGPKGAKGKDFTYAPRDDESAYFETTRTLAPNEGLTVAVAWPPGFVTRPTSSQQAAWFVTDNAVLLAGLLGLAMVLIYFVPVWAMVGRDPEKGTVVPLYAPPEGFSPAAARYVQRMGFDDKTFTAAVVSMAVKGFLTIEERGSRTYRLEKTGRRGDDLSMGEKAVARKLFAGGRNGIELKQTNHKTLGEAKKALQAWLRSEFEKTYFLRNTIYFLPGLGLSAIAVVILVLASEQPEIAAFLSIWLAGWSVGVYFLLRQVQRAWTVVFAGSNVLGMVGAVFTTLFAIPFFLGEGMGLWFFSTAASVEATVALGLLIFLNLLFYHLLKAPTLLGRRMMDQIEGFADYLSVAEKDRMNFHNPPERTPELFEKFLPYALALGVEHQWSEQFAGVLAQAGTPDGTGRRAYHPRWYRGGSFGEGSFSGLASSLSASFSGAISSASTAPGSSSGSSGGGSSGGGGGGGGGGW
ncbi:MAG: DUF2207 domain-containing protein [Alphaproteobacteria bacterium]|nr:DUF2207 domain-containing protein [Alphaproteobacteria bacterium]